MRRKLTKSERQQVYEKCKGHCAYCGCELEYIKMQVDHVKPLRIGGTDELDNMLPACKSCNHYKGTLNAEGFRQYLGGIYHRLMRDSIPFQVAVRFGLVKHMGDNVAFYFEKMESTDNCQEAGNELRGVNNMEKDINKILETEYSIRFDEIRKNMMAASYYKYGAVRENYENFRCMDALGNIEKRIQKYKETGNTEFLADAANFAMIEFMYPSIEGAKYTPTDNGACDIAGFSINEVRNFDK